MMKVIKSIVIGFGLIALLASCSNKKDANTYYSDDDLPTTLTSIKTDVKMAYIPGGEYMPFYGNVDSADVYVPPFYLDERPVTNEEFLLFVTENPQWRKSKIKAIYTDTSYLKDWPSDLELPKGADPKAPVTYVSWYAAKAYSRSVGKRLPTIDEWEFVAMADKDSANARAKKTYSDEIIGLYLIKERQYNPVKQSPPNYWGVYNMFDLIWEWTDDFNSILSMGDSRTGEASENLFCAGGAANVTDIMNYAAFMRFSMRTSVEAKFCIANLGFRCATDAE